MDLRAVDWNSTTFYDKRVWGLFAYEANSSLHIPYTELGWFISYSTEVDYVIQIFLGVTHKQYRFCNAGIWQNWLDL